MVRTSDERSLVPVFSPKVGFFTNCHDHLEAVKMLCASHPLWRGLSLVAESAPAS